MPRDCSFISIDTKDNKKEEEKNYGYWLHTSLHLPNQHKPLHTRHTIRYLECLARPNFQDPYRQHL